MANDGRWDLPVGGAWIRRAAPPDLDAAAAVLEDANRWLRSLGRTGWSEDSFTALDGRGRAQLVKALRVGGLYMARLSVDAPGRAEPAATVSLFDVDEVFWPGAPRDALYLHKLAVARRFAGLGLGRAIVEWAADRARDAGRPFLRLDCPRDNPRVRAYYEQAGFAHRGDLTAAGGFEAALYERPTGPAE